MRKTPIKKQSKNRIPTLRRRVWCLFSIYIRLRDCIRTTGSKEWGECFTCDETLPFDKLDAGHFIAGRHNGNLFSERGCHAQCRSCNRFKHGNVLEYRRQIVKLYGVGADLSLEAEARVVRKFTVEELLNLEAELKEKIKLLEV
ncbi:hypothetical protein LCGC14_0396250 [marine sediment metagenome]|uniref:Uncharacterized protein n=1 Tax=marine sediment metagenome TaxID=412755 RepID=A0A0F9W731_9ZZZZ